MAIHRIKGLRLKREAMLHEALNKHSKSLEEDGVFKLSQQKCNDEGVVFSNQNNILAEYRSPYDTTGAFLK